MADLTYCPCCNQQFPSDYKRDFSQSRLGKGKEDEGSERAEANPSVQGTAGSRQNEVQATYRKNIRF